MLAKNLRIHSANGNQRPAACTEQEEEETYDKINVANIVKRSAFRIYRKKYRTNFF